jgi:hypothetical protein
VAVSATIPNTEDIACWLGNSLDSPARFFKINEDMRPVKLQKIVLGYPHPVGTSQFHFEMSLSYKLRDILFKYADGKPTLIFCSTRKGVEHTCSTLLQQITFNFNCEQKQRICEAAIAVTENKLKECVMAGVGYHHAGMGKEDRQVTAVCLIRVNYRKHMQNNLGRSKTWHVDCGIVCCNPCNLVGGYQYSFETSVNRLQDYMVSHHLHHHENLKSHKEIAYPSETNIFLHVSCADSQK